MSQITVGDYLLSLIRATVKNERPKEKPNDFTWHDVFQVAKAHQVEELAFCSVQKFNINDEELVQWKKSHERNEVIDILQREEKQLILDAATGKEVDILPLKGSILKELYPEPIFRQMGDLDFLVESTSLDEMHSVMSELSYDATDVGLEDSHDVYTKLPYMEVEVHRRLLPPSEENHWYTDDIWERLNRDSNNSHLMKMDWTDFYMYHLLHFEKHYSMGGSGIRFIVDHYFIMKELKDKIDWDRVRELLPKMNYVEFEQMCNDLSNAIFEDGEMSEELKQKKDFIMSSGTYGTFEQYQKFAFEKYKTEQGIKTKKGFFFRRMFMERERMEFIYPSLKKHGWLLPFFWIHRLFVSVFKRWDRVKMELDEFKKKDD